MDRVLGRLWIGAMPDFQVPLASLGFSAVVDLRDGDVSPAREGVEVLRVANRDGDPWTREQVLGILDFIARHIADGKVLVACAAGMSRSASIVVGYLVRSGWDVAEAFDEVRRSRPRIMPVPKMLDSVLAAVMP